VLQQLDRSRAMPERGLSARVLAQRLRVDALQLAPALKALVGLDWVVEVAEDSPSEAPRFVLLADPATTSLVPLAQALMLPRASSLEPLWQGGALASLTLADLLAAGTPDAGPAPPPVAGAPD